MNKEKLIGCFVEIFPGFAEFWDSEENLSRDGDDYTFHGVCSRFSSFFIDNYSKLDINKMHELFGFIESIISEDPEDKNDLANALSTCFLENIAQTKSGDFARPYMGPCSRKYFDCWHVSPDDQE